MLKWLVPAVVIVAALLFGLRKYTLDHATEEGSFPARIYDKALQKDLLEMCDATMKKNQSHFADATPAQFAAACKCFADGMSEKLNDVAPGELQAFLQQESTGKTAQTILKKCGYAAGLN